LADQLGVFGHLASPVLAGSARRDPCPSPRAAVLVEEVRGQPVLLLSLSTVIEGEKPLFCS
jgi:hypothetical protein